MTLRKLALLALFALAGCAPRSPAPEAWQEAAVGTAGDARVEAFFDPDPPQEKGNVVWIRTMRGGRPVTTPPQVEARMPAMGTMPEMREPAEVKAAADGVWRAAFDLPMGGGWTLDVTVPNAGRASFAFTVGSEGLIGEPAGAGASAAPAAEPGQVRIEEARRQQFGIRTAPVERLDLEREIHALGQVVWDERDLQDVALTTGGIVRELHVAETGQAVRRGQVVAEVYSPELVAAQGELQLAVAHQERSGGALVDAARRKLLRLGLAEAQVDDIARSTVPLEAVPIRSPVAGWVVEKAVVEGSGFEAGEPLLRIAPLDRVWVEAEVYTADLSAVQVGQPVSIGFPNLGRAPVTGRIALLRPAVDPTAHTATARIALANPEGALLPGTYADVTVKVELAERLVVPADAVVYTGPRRLVFVDLGEGRLAPREVVVGARIDDHVEVISGLMEGEQVVSSGTFLVAAESRIRSATDRWEAPPDGS